MSKLRQFKFRFWDTKLSNMRGMPDDANLAIHLQGYKGCWSGCEQTLIPMQFTGLKDQNGVEIYEGDVLYYNDDSDDVSGLVKWENFGFIIDWQISGYRKNLNAWAKNNENEFKIIGNIYENPELLKN